MKIVDYKKKKKKKKIIAPPHPTPQKRLPNLKF
jgi:hypothetical protein